ncbi:MAG: prephenate dehydratase [Candidatus Nitrosocaldus sp.]|nr:prephenate dehydratase [Candidatus Nitrosocaldus sp.]MDW8000305.1 prephenate dehydratase [Candidatus Nitrosocaldus sp.]
MVRVVFQGERGAYSEMAALQYFSTGVELIPKRTIADVFYSAEVHEADYAIVPIENSIEGSVNETYDHLLSTHLKIQGEAYLRIEHCLIGYEGSSMDSIRYVYSHPQALGQCRGFIQRHGYEPIPYYDTAGSVKMLRERRPDASAAIASRLAAEIYGMRILAEGIEDSSNNYTRFLVLANEEWEGEGRRRGEASTVTVVAAGSGRGREGRAGGEAAGMGMSVGSKTSIIFTLEHRPRALYDVLGEFASRGINLTMIVSRPIKDRPWEYNFYLDFEGHMLDDIVGKCLERVKSKVVFLKVLGSYPKATIPYNT